MKKPLFLSLGMAVCLLLTSCGVTSDNPLSPPETAKPDIKLVGKWQSKDSPDEINIFTIKDDHWMHLEVRKKDPSSNESYDLFPTIIGNDQFLNVIELGKDDKGKPTRAGYFIVRYQISPDDDLSIWMMDQDKVASLVKTGKLKGIVKQNSDTSVTDIDVTLQSTGADLVDFIKKSGTKSLFSEKTGTMTPIKTVER